MPSRARTTATPRPKGNPYMGTGITGTHYTADLILFAWQRSQLHVLLIQRSHDSDAYPGYWRCPAATSTPAKPRSRPLAVSSLRKPA